ncbi:MAG: hypothetical protein ACREFM_04705 [Hypericibacter sp.]
MSRDSEFLFPGLIAVVILAALALDAFIYHHGLRVLGFPAALGLATAGLCALRLCQRAQERKRAGQVLSDDPSIEPASAIAVMPALRAMLGLIAAVPLVWLFGFAIGLPLYVGGYVKWRGSAWWVALLCAAIALAAALGFIELLGMPQPQGPLVWP